MYFTKNEKVLVMGILNITPDSFYDGNPNIDSSYIKEKFLSYKNSDIIDIGAESSRPFSKPITVDEEISRLSLFTELNLKTEKLLSIDSYKPEVIKFALNNGFDIINDISGGGHNNSNFEIASIFNVPIIVMHMQGTPQTMQIKPKYDNIIDDIKYFFEKKIDVMKNEFNLDDKNIILDPGIGFGKSIEDNYTIINNIKKFKSFGYPILIGLSRKSFLQKGSNGPKDVKSASLEAQLLSIRNGANIIRTHDVEETYNSLNNIS